MTQIMMTTFHRIFSSSRNHQVFVISPNTSNRQPTQTKEQKTNINSHSPPRFQHQPPGDGLFYSGPPRSVEELTEMLQRQGVSVKKDGEMGTNRDPIEGKKTHRLHRNTFGGCQNRVTVRNKLFLFMKGSRLTFSTHCCGVLAGPRKYLKRKKYIET